MYKLKYYLWLICIVVFSVVNIYAAGEDKCTPIDMDVTPDYIGSCTNDDNTGSNLGSSPAVWYKFQTGTEGYYEIKMTNSSFFHSIVLFEVDCLSDNLSLINSMNKSEPIDEFDFVQENLITYLSANTTYTFSIGKSQTCTSCETQGTFCVEVNQTMIPLNEECLTATEIELTPDACVTGSNYYASDANPQPSCNPHTGASVWYQILAPASGMIQMETFPNFSEVITVYEGTCGSLTEIFCSVNGEDNDGTLIIDNLTSEDIYYIQVTGNFPTIEADNGLECHDDDNYITISVVYDCPTDPPLTEDGSPIPKPCNDNNTNTTNDIWKVVEGNCECVGTCANNVGDICDDGIPNPPDSPYDFWDADCNCQDQCLRTVADCPNNNHVINAQCRCECPETVGEGCDNSDPSYVWNESCECVQSTQGGADYCPPDMIITAEDIANYTYFQTSDYIETDGSVIVEVGEDLTLNAKNYVKLKPGFNAKAESTMRAYIEGCEPIVERAEEFATASVKHFPNPFRDEFTLEFELDLDADVNLIISDVNGRMINQTQIENLNRGIQTHNVTTKNWILGIYFYQVLIEEQQTGILKRANGTLVKM